MERLQGMTTDTTSHHGRRPTAGLNHLAMVTTDLDRLCAFYVDVFDAEVARLDEPGMRHAMIDLGAGACLHPFEVPVPDAVGSEAMFERGHLDHFAVNVADDASFALLRRRLVEVGATDGTTTDYGNLRSVFFRDPDGCCCEIAQWIPGGVPRRHPDRLQLPYETEPVPVGC